MGQSSHHRWRRHRNRRYAIPISQNTGRRIYPNCRRSKTNDAIKWYSTKSPPAGTSPKNGKGIQSMPTSLFETLTPPNTSASSSLADARPNIFANDPDLIRITRYFFEHNKPVASVCHGVEIPCRAGVVKRATHGLRLEMPI